MSEYVLYSIVRFLYCTAIPQALQMTVDSMVSPRVATLEQGLGAVQHIKEKKEEEEVLRSPVQASIAKVNCVRVHLTFSENILPVRAILQVL